MAGFEAEFFGNPDVTHEENFGVKVITFEINQKVFINQLWVRSCRSREGWSVCLSSFLFVRSGNKKSESREPDPCGHAQKKPPFERLSFVLML